MIEVTLKSVGATHHDDGVEVDVASVSKMRVVGALPPLLLEMLQSAEEKLCVDDRGGTRTPSHSIGSYTEGNSGSGGSGTPGSPRFDRNGSIVMGSPRSPRPLSGRKTPKSSPRSRSLSNPHDGMSGMSGMSGSNHGGGSGSGGSGGRDGGRDGGSGGGGGHDFFDYPVRVMAEQLTYVDYAMFKKIPTLEFLDKSWERNRYENVAEYTRHFTDRWNGMVEYLATLVLHGDGPDDRAKRIEYLIDLGDVLWKEYHNFQSASMINMALEHLSLKTLKQSWERVNMKMVDDSQGPVPPNVKRQTIKERIKRVFWHENNYSNYRQLESRIPSNSPTIPSMMVHHKYLFDTHEGAPHLLCRSCGSSNMKSEDNCTQRNCKQPLSIDYRNFGRSRNLADFIRKLRRCQRTPYTNIVANREVCNMISRGVQPHIMYFDQHTRSATRKMLAAGKALGATE